MKPYRFSRAAHCIVLLASIFAVPQITFAQLSIGVGAGATQTVSGVANTPSKFWLATSSAL